MGRNAIVSIVLVLALGSISASAKAQEAETSTDRISSVIKKALPEDQNQQIALPESVNDQTIDFSSSEMQVAVPILADESVKIDVGDGRSIELALPLEMAVSEGELASDGTVVYASNNESEAVAVQVLDDGVRLQTVIGSEDASETYTYQLGEGAVPALQQDGSVEILQEVGDGALAVVGVIESPWAVDANGDSVETYYTVEGANIVQHVDLNDDVSFPVTADPKFTSTWWNKTFYFNRKETRNIAFGVTSAGTLATWIPTIGTVVAGRLLQLYGGTFMGYWLADKCGKFVFYGTSAVPVPQPYSGKEAGGYCK